MAKSRQRAREVELIAIRALHDGYYYIAARPLPPARRLSLKAESAILIFFPCARCKKYP